MRAKKQHYIGLLYDADYWLSRAEKTRVIAELIPHAESREAMLRIAKDYEAMAKLAEQRLKKATPLPAQ
jgi:hypothetical protein